MTQTCSARACLGAFLAAALLAIGCQDALAPKHHQPGSPALVQTGPEPAISGLGTLGSGDSTPGSDLQQFDFDVKADLTGRFFYKDWQFNASITVDQDTATKITAFQDGWSSCADNTHGAAFAGRGRTDGGGYIAFTLYACDDGPAGSGADSLQLTTEGGYNRGGLLSSGDVVKTVASTATTGSLKIKTATTGDSLPPRYRFSASGPQGSTADTIGVNASRTFAGIATGDYTVVLHSVPTNCTVSGDTSRVVTVRAGETDSTTFAVSCAAATSGTGNLTITTATTGADIPAGYTFTASGPAGSITDTIGANSSRTFAGIATGDYSVVLHAVPTNCAVSGDTSRTATVPSGGTGTVAYSVSCTATPAAATHLAFTVQPSNTTAGSTISPPVLVAALDSAGNTATAFTGAVTVAIGNNPGGGTLSGTTTAAAVNGVATFSNLSINQAGNGYTLTAAASGLAGATSGAFNITAPVTTGDLTITTATTGQDIPTSYTVTATGPSYPSGKSASIGSNATLTAPGIISGDYTVQLSAVPANCTVSGGASRTVNVPAGGTATVSYSVSCVALSGNLTVSTSTSGSSLPSGYTVTVDGSQSRSIGINSSVTYTDLPAGSHSVALTNVPDNCTVSGSNPRGVSVPSGGTATTTFSVSCVTPNQPPSVNTGSDETVLLGLLYSLNWSFSDPNNDGPWSYTINWGDGSSTSGSTSGQGSRSTGHTYVLIGSYTIRVTVTDSHGASGSDTKVLTVVAPLPGLP